MNNLKNNLGQSANLFDQVNKSIKGALSKGDPSEKLYWDLYFHFMSNDAWHNACNTTNTRRIIKHIVRVEVNCDFVYTKTSLVP